MIKNVLIVLLLLYTISSSNEKISLQLLWKHQFEFAGFYMAKEKGYYDDIGFDVELKEFNNNIDIVDDVQNHKSTFGIAYPSVILDKANGANVILLSAIFQSSPHVFVSLQSSNIHSIKDFKNKTVMMSKDAVETASLLSMLTSEGVKQSDIKIVQPTFNINDLITKKVDILSAYISDEIYSLNQQHIEYNIWDPADYGFDFYNNILFTSSDFAQKYPNKVQAFNNASLKGWRYAFDHIDETVNVILKKYNTQSKTREALLYEANSLKNLVYKDNIPLGNLDKNKIQRIYDVYNLLGLTKGQIDIDRFIFNNTQQIRLNFKEKQWIKNNTIKVGISPWYPITSYDPNRKEAIGVGIDFLELIAKKLHLRIEYVPDQWSVLLQKFKEHKVDLLPTTYYTQERAKFGDYTTAYMDIKELLYVKQNSTIKGFNDLKGKKIAMVRSYGTIDKIKNKFPSIEIVEVDSLEETVQMVINGDVDAIFNTQFSIESFLKNNFIQGLKPIFQTVFPPSPIHYFTNKTKPILHSIFQKGVNSITSEDKNQILNRWLTKKYHNNDILTKLTNEEKEYIKHNKVIKMCNNPNWEPIEFAKNGDLNNMAGISIDILHEVSKKLGVKFVNVPTKNWSESQQFLKEKKCDILPCAIKTAKREQYAKFTKPYLNYKLAIVTKKDKPLARNLDDVIDKTIARKKGSGLITKLKKQYPNVKIIETKDYLEALRKVSNGQAYCTIATLPIISHYISTFSLNNLQIAGYTDMTYNLSIAVRDDKPILANILDKALMSIPKSKHKQIYQNWTNIQIEQSINYALIKKILIVVVIILLLFLYRQYILNKANNNLQQEVHKKTLELKKLNNELKEINENLEQKIIIEIEKAKKIEHELFESQKLAAMGEMIGNIAHQWRQPLSVISTTATGVLMKQEYGMIDDKSLAKDMENINNAAQFLSQTIDDFRDLVKGDVKPQDFNLSENIKKCLDLEIPMLKQHNIELISQLDDSINLHNYPNALIQSLLNIINNAKDALLTYQDDNKYIFVTSYTKHNNAIIEIKDNGKGIPANIMPHIFEAYFTTKHKTQGTGLGLHMTYNMITQEMKGKIEVKNVKYNYNNNKYEGALFTISIPLS